MDYPNLILSWDEHQAQVINIVQNLYSSEVYCDCTLIAAGGYAFDVHRIVVSACSPVLSKIIQEYTAGKPEITLAEVTKYELAAIIEYMYTGEASVALDRLERFIEIGKELQIVHLSEYVITSQSPSLPKCEPYTEFLEVSNSQEFPTLDLDSQCELNEDLIGNVDDSFIAEEAIEIVKEESSWCLPEEIKMETKSKSAALPCPQPVKKSTRNSNVKEINFEKSDKNMSLILDLGDTFMRRYQCRKCGSLYSHKRTILHHIHWICGQPPTYACTLCSYRGKRKFQLRSHLEHVHLLIKTRKKKKRSVLNNLKTSAD